MPTSAAPALPDLPSRRSAPLAALLGWLVPGLGQAYVGRPVKALLYLAVIGGTYALGLWLAGFACVSWERDPYWFGAQALAGGPTALTAWLTRDLRLDARVPTYDVGLLYVTVAALLNAIAVADALGTVEEREQARAQARAAHRAAAQAREAQDAARAAANAALWTTPPVGEETLVLPPEPPPAGPDAPPATPGQDAAPPREDAPEALP